MLANALSERDRAWLGMSQMCDTQAGEEVAR
jgi:hypothetical protein